VAYRSPEQAKGQDVGPQADIWAFGCVLFEMLAGGRPFRGESTARLIGQILEAADLNPFIVRRWQAWLAKDKV